MKTFLKTALFASIFGGAALSAHAGKPIATCHSAREGLILCIYDESSAPDWKSISIIWSRASACKGDFSQKTYGRQFVQRQVIQNDAEKIRAKQSNRFIIFGNKTEFTYDRIAGTAMLSGKNGSAIRVSDGPSGPSEKQGKFKIEFDHCE